MPTHDCLQRDLLLAEGQPCRVGFHALHWFDVADVVPPAR